MASAAISNVRLAQETRQFLLNGSPDFARPTLLDLPVSWRRASSVAAPRSLLFGLSRFDGSG